MQINVQQKKTIVFVLYIRMRTENSTSQFRNVKSTLEIFPSKCYNYCVKACVKHNSKSIYYEHT